MTPNTETPTLPLKGKTWQWGWQTEPPCPMSDDGDHSYVERPHNPRGFNYADCQLCGLTKYTDSSD